MPKNQKGVNPLIATILLLLVCMAIGGIIWSWLQGYTQSQRQASEEQAGSIKECAGASFKIDIEDSKPTYYSALSQTKLTLINTGRIDLNDFRATSFYTTGESDLNTVTSVNIEEGGSGVVWARTTSVPNKIEVVSVDCDGVKASVQKKDLTIS